MGKIKSFFGNAEPWSLVAFLNVNRASHENVIYQHKAQRDIIKDEGQLLLS